MQEVRQQVQEEGREARNLVAFHVTVDTPGRSLRSTGRAALPPPRRAAPRPPSRLRSASAGRDKRSELRARYWALLFGNLRQCVGEIYNTVEGHENLNECQEVILVLENYTRDFKALGEWFRLKWEYENTPPPQRPQSLAWEIRKTDFVRPESRRAHSVKSSPSVSGKNSPCLSGHNTPSGKNSPNLTGKASPGSGKISPRISGHATSPKGSIEFFSSKISSKIATKPEPKVTKETRLSDIKEKDVKDAEEVKGSAKEEKDSAKEEKDSAKEEKQPVKPIVEVGKAKEIPNATPKQVIIKSPKRAANVTQELSSQALATIDKLNAMESDFLAKQLTETAAKNENILNQDVEKVKCVDMKAPVLNDISVAIESVDQDSHSTDSPSKSEDNFADISNESSKCDDKILDSSNKDEVKPENKPDANEIKQDITNISNGHISDSESLKYHNSMAKITNDCAEKDNTPKNDIINDTKEKEKPKTETQDNGKDSMTIPKKDEANSKKDDFTDFKKDELIVPETKVQELKDTDNKKDDAKKMDAKVISEAKPARPAYSQAAAKPKLVTLKAEVKTPTKAIARSKTVVEIRTMPAKSRTFVNRNQKNKCSYPFNLTTGRTSLFDGGTNKVNAAKKTLTTNKTQMAAGDNRNQKSDAKNRPTRPTSLKINETGDKQEKMNPNLEKIKDRDEYSSSDTVVTQIDMSRIESSESLKTIVPENDHEVTNSIEVLNVDGNKIDNEGWLTVKSRRLSRESKKSKSHWTNRFHQPSATTSLPTLNMIESPKSETNPIVTSQLDRAKSEQPQKPDPQKVEKIVKVDPKIDLKPEKAIDMSIIRQKSDVTGLKTRSSRTKALKKDKKEKKDSEKLTKNRLHSSLESLTIGLARSQESTEDAFDFDKWKAEFKSTFKYLEYDEVHDDTEILKTADPSEMSEIAEMTSQIEENERKISLALDFQSEVDQRKLCEEEDLLNRQIMELQQVSDVEIDTETDETETDAEIVCDITLTACQSTETLSSLSASLEDQYETALAGMTWADRVETLGALEALVARDPGRAQQLHAKLSQGIKRRGSLQDALRRLQAKQARAERQRTRLHTERAKKIHQLLSRVEEVMVAKHQLIEEKRIRMERRLQKAARNRDQHLKDIVRKAHDEEEKLREIAFIKQLEAENRRHEFLEQCRSHTTRLREMRRERLDKLEQKAAREAAVGARRQAIEAARKQHVESLLEKRKERDARVEELKEQKKQERDDAAREKAEGVKSRLSALAAAAELEADALRSRIRDKQDASQQRLESHLQAIREKATGPRQATTSESQEPDKKDEEEENARIERERKEREGQKNIRRKARKLRQKLIASSMITSSANSDAFRNITHPQSSKMHKAINQLHNLLKPFFKEQEKKEDPKDAKDIATNNNEEAKNKRKKKNKSRDRQLSAGDSICSSMSDMSRSGNNGTHPVLDAASLERILNELYRICTGADNVHSTLRQGVTALSRLHAMVTLIQLLFVAAEREHLTGQIHTKALNTCICIILRICAHCKMSSSYWFTNTGIIHAVELLQIQMEKNTTDDPKEEELTRNLADSISVGLNLVLVDHHQLKSDDLAWHRARGHGIISLLALSGCLSRPERCRDRTQLQTLINVAADFLAPVDSVDGQERVMALQHLHSVLGPSIFLMREDLCSMFAEGAQLSQHDIFVKAARIAHALRALAEIDPKIVQESFGEGGWPIEFKAAVARLLSQHAPSDKEAPRTVALRYHDQRVDENVSETFALDLIMLIGFVFVNSPQLLETITGSWSVIKMLCNLPANWLVSPPQMHKLVPTLLVLAQSADAAGAIAREINMDLLQEYLALEAVQDVALIKLLRPGKKEERNGKKQKKPEPVKNTGTN